MARDQQKIEQVLQTCLDQVENGQESVESVLARYPELADQLRPELEVALWLSAQKDLLNPRPGWVAASKRRVLARYQEEIRTETASTGWLGWNPSWIPWFNKRAVQVTFALVLLLALLVGGNGVVMAAQDSLPGDRLYPIKTALEKVNLAISLDQTQEAQLQVEYTKRRVDELNRLVLAHRNSDVTEAVNNLATQVDQTVNAIDSAANQNAAQTKEIASDFAALMRYQNQMLEGLSTIADGSTLYDLQKAKIVSEKGATAASQQLLQIIPSPTPTTRPRNPRVASNNGEPATKVPTSVPTKTLRPLSTTPPKATPTPAPIFEPFEEPTATNTPRPAPTATNTPRPLPTNTYTPTQKPPTEAPIPTDTPTVAPSDTPTPTNTPVPPTNTPTNTPPAPEIPTNTPVPSDTPVPPAVNQSTTPTTPPTEVAPEGGG